MPLLRTLLFVTISLLLSACVSRGPLAPPDPLPVQPPPAALMEYRSNSLKLLDDLFSISASPSSETRPPLQVSKPNSLLDRSRVPPWLLPNNPSKRP